MVKMHSQVEMIAVDRLKPYEKNAKKHPPEQIECLALHIEGCGWDQPIVCDENMVILKGHGRRLAALHLGLTEVPVVVVKGLSEAQRKAIRLADNKLAETAWDEDLLKIELGDLQLAGWDVGELGFELDGDGDGGTDGNTDPDDVPEVDGNEFGVERGQIWQLGKHRLMCGDSASGADFQRLIGENKASITMTSPPYNAGSLNIKGNETTKKKYNQFDDNQTESQFLDFLTNNLSLCLKYSDTVFYNIGLVENNKRVIIDLQKRFINHFKDVIYWKKSTVAPHIQPGVINNLIEFILCFGDGKRKFADAQFGQGTFWNVIEGNNASGNEFSKIHKATFPVYLPEKIIENFCHKTGSVIEPFCGTGTTLIACEKTGRICYGMEIDRNYCSVIIKRWQDFTGQKAELLEAE